MRTIRVGRKDQRSFNPSEVAAEVKRPASESWDDEQRARFLESVNQMPKEKRVSALRSVGLDDVADDMERSFAEEHLREVAAENRAKRYEELCKLDEEERLPLLTAEGYEEEANALYEKLTAAPVVGEGSGEANEPVECKVNDEPATLSTVEDVEPKKTKRTGRPRVKKAKKNDV